MKRALLSFLFLFLACELQGQLLPGEKPGDNKRRSREKNKGGFYVGFAGKGANMIDDWGIEFGVRLGAMTTENLGLGVGIYTLISKNVDIPMDVHSGRRSFLRFSYGGVEAEYLFDLSKKISLTAGALIGLGVVNYSESAAVDIAAEQNGNWLFIAEPCAGVLYKFTRGLSIGLSIGYRATAGAEFYSIDDADLAGTTLTLCIKSIM